MFRILLAQLLWGFWKRSVHHVVVVGLSQDISQLDFQKLCFRAAEYCLLLWGKDVVLLGLSSGSQ